MSRLPRFHDVSVRLLRGLEYLPGSRIRLEPSVARFRLDSPEIQALSRTVLATRQARCLAGASNASSSPPPRALDDSCGSEAPESSSDSGSDSAEMQRLRLLRRTAAQTREAADEAWLVAQPTIADQPAAQPAAAQPAELAAQPAI